MKYLIKNARAYVGDTFIDTDILISGSLISRIGKNIVSPDAEMID